jgi:hypothetical protein
MLYQGLMPLYVTRFFAPPIVRWLRRRRFGSERIGGIGIYRLDFSRVIAALQHRLFRLFRPDLRQDPCGVRGLEQY